MIETIKKFVKLRKYELVLTFLSALVYFRWLSFDYLVNGDWMFYYSESQAGKLMPSIWRSDTFVGLVETTPFRAPIESLASLLSDILGVDSNVLDKILYLWPIVFILPVASYLLFKYIIKDDRGAAVASIIFCYNTYFLTIDTAGHNMITDSVIFCVLSIYFIFKSVETTSYKYSVLSAILLAVGGYYDFRMVYITIFIIMLLLPILYNKEFKKFIKLALTFSSVFLILNLFWVLPVLFVSSNFGEGVLDRPLFGDQYWSISHAITLMHPFWNPSGIVWFSVNSIPLYFWILPMLVFAGFMINRKDKTVTIFTIMFIIGVFLTKQSDQPFAHLYRWAYDNFPGFNAFRESTKFYYLVAISSSVIVGYFVKHVQRYKYVKVWVPVLISLLFLFNTVPLITGKIEHMFIERTVSKDYALFNDYINSSQEPFRMLWLPIASVFAPYTRDKSVSNIISFFTLDMIKSYGEFTQEVPDLKDITKLMNSSYIDRVLDSAGIKFAGVPVVQSSADSKLFYYYGGKNNSDIYNQYVDLMDKSELFNKVNIGQSNLQIYENKDYDQYISVSDRLVELESYKKLNDKYGVILSKTGESNFFVKEESDIPSDKIIDLAEDLRFNNLDMITDSIKVTKKVKNGDLLVTTPENYRYFADRVGDKTRLSARDTLDLMIDEREMLSSGVTRASKEIDRGADYIMTGQGLIPVNAINNPVGYASDRPRALDVSDYSLLKNGSFEFGPWRNEVDNCNNYDNFGKVSQRLVDTSYKGAKSLELSASRHTACTNTSSIKVVPGKEYLLSISYKSDNSKEAGVYISADEDSEEVLKDVIPITNTNWNTYNQLIKISDNINSIKLYIYAYGDMDSEKNKTVLYDDIRLSEVKRYQDLTLDDSEYDTEADQKLNDSKDNIFIIRDKYVTMKNILDNGDFSKGLWQDQVGDCNNYDDNSDISMYIIKTEGTDNSDKLGLESKKHDACTSTEFFPVKPGASYMIGFDYYSNVPDAVSYYLDFGNNDITNLRETLPNSNEDKWQTFSKVIRVADNANRASFGLYALEKKDKNVKVLYDNVYMVEIPNITNKFYIYRKNKNNYNVPEDIKFNWVNQNLKKVSINGASGPFYLNMSEGYHPDWKIKVGDRYIDSNNHYKLNGFLNGWYIDPARVCNTSSGIIQGCSIDENGKYSMNMSIEFSPQKWYSIGVTVSVLGAMVTLMYLLRGRNLKSKVR